MKKTELRDRINAVWTRSSVPVNAASIKKVTGQSLDALRPLIDELVIDGYLDMESDDLGNEFWVVPGVNRPDSTAKDKLAMVRLAALDGEIASKRAAEKKANDAASARRTAEAALVAEAEAKARAAIESTKKKPTKSARKAKGDDDDDGEKGGALVRMRKELTAQNAFELATSAKGELEKGVDDGKKSMLLSGALSMMFGPLGWLYAGSFREAIPAGLGWLLVAALASKIFPMFLLMPVLMVVLPISGIAGLVYAWQHNKSGERQRLFDKDDDDKPKKLKS